MVCPICGPKCSIYYMIISVWGIVMLFILGGFFYIRAPALFEDLPLSESDWHQNNFTHEFVKAKYEQNAINCFIAAGIYVAIFIFSFIQQRMNAQGNFEMS